MEWVILDGLDRETGLNERISRTLTSRLAQAGMPYTYFRMDELKIAPCRSCGACGYKSPGKCVINDDLHGILRVVARSGVLVFLSPIRFGGYSSCLKKALERFMNLGMPYYTVHKGHLLHPMRYGEKSVLSIGVKEADVAGEDETFRLLLERNARNLLSPHQRAVILNPADAEVEPALGQALEVALQW